MTYFFVALGGAIGSLLRFILGILIGSNIWLTLLINISGCFMLGVFSNYLKHNLPNFYYYGLTAVLCGGFTTFSTFSLESIELLNQGLIIKAVIYISLSLILGLTAVFVGINLKL